MTNKTVNVPNISCGHCVATIEREVSEIDGVSEVKAEPYGYGIELPMNERPYSVRIPAAIEKAKACVGGFCNDKKGCPHDITATEVALAEALWERGHHRDCVGLESCCDLVDEGSALIAFTEKVEELT